MPRCYFGRYDKLIRIVSGSSISRMPMSNEKSLHTWRLNNFTEVTFRRIRTLPCSLIFLPGSPAYNSTVSRKTTNKVDEHNTDSKDAKLNPSFLKRENVWTIPNFLCIARMGMAPALGYMVVNSHYTPALGLLVIAGLTDLLDGWIARVIPGQSSMMGSFLDPMADKILIGTLFLSLTYVNLIPVALTALILSRDLFLIGAGFYIRYRSLQPPRTLSRYFDVTSPSAQLAPTLISKINTGIQLSLIGITMASTVVTVEQSYLVALWYCTGGSTILSALSYAFTKNTYRILRESSKTRVNRKSSPQ